MPRLGISRKRGEKLVVQDAEGNQVVLSFVWSTGRRLKIIAEGPKNIRILRGEHVGHYAEGTEIFGNEGGKVLANNE